MHTLTLTKARYALKATLLVATATLAMAQSSDGPLFFGVWTEMGPETFYGINALTRHSNVVMSGQVSSIAVDHVNDQSGNTVYVGSSGGGVWKSTNGLSSNPDFELISDPRLTLATGAIALDSRTNPPTIYVGTGDADNPSNINSYAGMGILISRNGGETWTQVLSADGGAHPFKGMGFSKIIVDPDTPNMLLAATGVGSDGAFAHSGFPQGNTSFNHLGIYRSIDAGNTWSRVKSTPLSVTNINDFFHIDLVHEPVRDLYLAGISKQGIFASPNGVNWWLSGPLPTAGLPAAENMHRISLATRNGTIWALVLVQPGFPQPCDEPCVNYGAHKLFQLRPQDTQWHQILEPPDLSWKGFLGYVAAPPNSQGLVVGAEHLYRTDWIGGPWTKVEFGINVSLHGDQHAIAFVNPDKWYVGDDGGAFATLDRGATWRSLNATIRTTEFYSVSRSPLDPAVYVGGQQDNGVSVTSNGTDWEQVMGGDGMYLHSDPRNPNAFFVSTQFGRISHLDAPSAFARIVVDFTDKNDASLGADATGAFLTPFENLPPDPRLYSGFTPQGAFDFEFARMLLIGARHLWLAGYIPGLKTQAVKVAEINPPEANTNEVIQHVLPDPQDATAAYLVTSRGATHNSGYNSRLLHVSGITLARMTDAVSELNPPPPGLSNSDVLGHGVVSPHCSEMLYLSKVGFLEGQKIFRTTTAGQTWINISGNLPNVPVHWITLDPANPNVIYVATNVGAFVATDGGVEGEQWRRLGIGLPNVPVMQLKVTPDRKLLAATFGRGIWTLDLPALPQYVRVPRPPTMVDISASPTQLSPPDHRMVDVVVNYSAADDCGTPVCTLSVVSSEPSSGLPGGDVSGDIEVVDAHHVRLRAERSPQGSGRTYTITITCTGTDGLSTSRTLTVFVPK